MSAPSPGEKTYTNSSYSSAAGQDGFYHHPPPPPPPDSEPRRSLVPPPVAPRPTSVAQLPHEDIDTSNNPEPSQVKSFFQQVNQFTAKCHNCGGVVYLYEKVAPTEDTVFHKACFRCAVCLQHLTLQTYTKNQSGLKDRQVYCKKHAPKAADAQFGGQAVGIMNALRAQQNMKNSKFDPSKHNYIPGTGENRKSRPESSARFSNRFSTEVRYQQGQAGDDMRAPQVGLESLHIAGAIQAQKNQKVGRKHTMSKHHYLPEYMRKKQTEIMTAQEELERIQREEEDYLIEKFTSEQQQEDIRVEMEFDSEWQIGLEQLVSEHKKLAKGRKMSSQQLETQLEAEKRHLRDQLDLKKSETKRVATIRLRQKEQEETSVLVGKHGTQMLGLLFVKQKELEEEIVELQPGCDDEDSSEGPEDGRSLSDLSTSEEGHTFSVDQSKEVMVTRILNQIEVTVDPAQIPEPHPPNSRKRDLFIDASVFGRLDQHVIEVAAQEPESFTQLVQLLVRPALTDLEKARAIFRWITVKDLNVLDFSDIKNKDTPMGLLRGIKLGSETYHTLFRRLCSFAGLHCREIKGHSKSVGYEPGMKLEPESFQNTWNCVLIDGDWRLIQCNWGARHLVLNKDGVTAVPGAPEDNIRYQYDEHYFLTDPDEFIQEFWPYDPEWQLLENHISLRQFEQLPFVRSVFFHYQMRFEGNPDSVLHTDESGGVEMRMVSDAEDAEQLVFHYQLRFAAREQAGETEYRGTRLDRFVYQTSHHSQVLWKVFVPAVGEYFLEIFANRVAAPQTPHSPQPFRLKCACKFRIICSKISNKMHPLPACSTGEWGPAKALRHFGIEPLSHSAGALDVDNELNMSFRCPQPNLTFLLKLRMNGIDDSALAKYVTHSVKRKELSCRVNFPQPGQYGVDIYVKGVLPKTGAETTGESGGNYSHAAKYLVNCRKVEHPDAAFAPVESSPVSMCDTFGPTLSFKKFGMKCKSHKESRISLKGVRPLDIEMSVSTNTHFSAHFLRSRDFKDLRECCQIVANKKRVTFRLDVPEPGTFVFALYARPEKEASTAPVNVFNYQIVCTQADDKDKSHRIKN